MPSVLLFIRRHKLQSAALSMFRAPTYLDDYSRSYFCMPLRLAATHWPITGFSSRIHTLSLEQWLYFFDGYHLMIDWYGFRVSFLLMMPIDICFRRYIISTLERAHILPQHWYCLIFINNRQGHSGPWCMSLTSISYHADYLIRLLTIFDNFITWRFLLMMIDELITTIMYIIHYISKPTW